MPVPNDTTYVNGINNHYRPQTKLREGDVFTAANEVWGKVIFLHLFVILFTGGGGSASVHAGRSPRRRHPPPRRRPPRGGTPPRRYPPGTELAGRYSQCAGGTHPTGMQCL